MKVFYGKGVYPYSWSIKTSVISHADGYDKITHISLGYLKIEHTRELCNERTS